MKAEIKDSIQSEIRNEVNILIAAEIKIYETKIESLKLDFDKQIYRSKGIAHHLQAQLTMKEGPAYGARNLAAASINYLKGDDESNLQAVLKSLVETCLPDFNKQSYEEMKNEFESRFDNLILLLGEKNINGRYARAIIELKRAIEQAKKRT